MAPYGSPHISHVTMGPVIGKSKHVDYYKHMKEKYHLKKAQAEDLFNQDSLTISPTKVNRKLSNLRSPSIKKQAMDYGTI